VDFSGDGQILDAMAVAREHEARFMVYAENHGVASPVELASMSVRRYPLPTSRLAQTVKDANHALVLPTRLSRLQNNSLAYEAVLR